MVQIEAIRNAGVAPRGILAQSTEHYIGRRTPMTLVRNTLVIGIVLGALPSDSNAQSGAGRASARPPTLHKTVQIDGLDIFYREAGPKDAPTILLLHGFPTSSHMFRNLIPALSDRYRLVAPDYPGYGNSSMPSRQRVRLQL